MDRKGTQVMFVCIHVCMFFEVLSRLRALTEPKMVPYGRVLDNTLLRHVFSAMVSQRERGT